MGGQVLRLGLAQGWALRLEQTWEVAAWEIAQLGSGYLGKCPLEGRHICLHIFYLKIVVILFKWHEDLVTENESDWQNSTFFKDIFAILANINVLEYFCDSGMQIENMSAVNAWALGSIPLIPVKLWLCLELSLFAEICGYLGTFLGISFLQLVDFFIYLHNIITAWIFKIKNKR